VLSGVLSEFLRGVLVVSPFRAVYDYDSLGGIASIKYWWETLQGNGTYVQAPIFAADATYSHALGLKDSAGFFGPSGGGFSLQRRENYAYDAQNDFLTQVDYNDGQSNELQNWDYDAAGNRGSYISNIPGAQWTFDNLNRIVTSPFGSYTHDLAGNRLTGPGQTLSWDVTNRLTGLNGVTHRYRNDGMRVQKVAANGDTYRWHYDAQMPVEETRLVGGQTTIMRNIVGPRGIDVQFDGANAAFPLYDIHGNAKALLARSGSSFTTTAWRQYDVWGSLRTGSALGGASQRYCANLGHVTDDESGLIYMRARFYEPWTGRFVSEDPAMDGSNWFMYARNAPIGSVDFNGKNPTASQLFWTLIGAVAGITGVFIGINVVSSGEAIIAVTLGIISMLPGGLPIAMALGAKIASGAGAAALYGGIGYKAVIALAALATIAMLFALWDDTWCINELFGMGPNEELQTPPLFGG